MLRIVVLGFLLCLVALGGLFARRIYVERQPITGTARFLVGGHKLQIDRAMVRNPELRDGGATNRLDLVLKWPAMHGAAQHMGTTDRSMLGFVGLEDATAPTIRRCGSGWPATSSARTMSKTCRS